MCFCFFSPSVGSYFSYWEQKFVYYNRRCYHPLMYSWPQLNPGEKIPCSTVKTLWHNLLGSLHLNTGSLALTGLGRYSRHIPWALFQSLRIAWGLHWHLGVRMSVFSILAMFLRIYAVDRAIYPTRYSILPKSLHPSTESHGLASCPVEERWKQTQSTPKALREQKQPNLK